MASGKSHLLSLIALCSIAATALAQRFTVTDLGPLTPTGINTWAQVVGSYNGRSYIWTNPGGFRNLGLLPGGTFSHGAAINDLGWVVGTADGLGTVVSHMTGYPDTQCSNLTQPFLWKPLTGMQGLGTVRVFAEPGQCDVPFHGTSLNDGGQVVGFNYEVGSTFQDGFVWTKASGMTVVIGNWPPTSIGDISNTGEIVGQVDPRGEGIGYATSWKNGVQTDLGALGPVNTTQGADYSSLAAGVNDWGLVVGWSTTVPGYFCIACQIHAVLWTRTGEIRDLGTLSGDSQSLATKVNFFGQVVGSSGNTLVRNNHDYEPPVFDVTGRPFIWTERSGMQDLNSLIPGNSGWVLNTATDINIWGQIVGQGTRDDDQTHGYLLTPTNPFQLF
jgi:probable HAF family extracellular repeat protein